MKYFLLVTMLLVACDAEPAASEARTDPDVRPQPMADRRGSRKRVRYRQALEAGIRLFEAQDHDGSIAQFAQACKIDPTDWRGHTWTAFAYIQLAGAEPRDGRRKHLLAEAKALTGAMLKQANIKLTDPLYLYLLGLIASLEHEPVLAYDYLKVAQAARRGWFGRYEETQLRDRVRRAFAKAMDDLRRPRKPR